MWQVGETLFKDIGENADMVGVTGLIFTQTVTSKSIQQSTWPLMHCYTFAKKRNLYIFPFYISEKGYTCWEHLPRINNLLEAPVKLRWQENVRCCDLVPSLNKHTDFYDTSISQLFITRSVSVSLPLLPFAVSIAVYNRHNVQSKTLGFVSGCKVSWHACLCLYLFLCVSLFNIFSVVSHALSLSLSLSLFFSLSPLEQLKSSFQSVEAVFMSCTMQFCGQNAFLSTFVYERVMRVYDDTDKILLSVIWHLCMQKKVNQRWIIAAFEFMFIYWRSV